MSCRARGLKKEPRNACIGFGENESEDCKLWVEKQGRQRQFYRCIDTDLQANGCYSLVWMNSISTQSLDIINNPLFNV